MVVANQLRQPTAWLVGMETAQVHMYLTKTKCYTWKLHTKYFSHWDIIDRREYCEWQNQKQRGEVQLLLTCTKTVWARTANWILLYVSEKDGNKLLLCMILNIPRSTVVLLSQWWGRFRMAACTQGIGAAPKKWSSGVQKTYRLHPFAVVIESKMFGIVSCMKWKRFQKVVIIKLSSLNREYVWWWWKTLQNVIDGLHSQHQLSSVIDICPA